MATRRTLASIAADSIPFAKEELARGVGDLVEFRRVGEEAVIVETESTGARDLAGLAARTPLVFPRHLTEVVAEFDPAEAAFASVADFAASAVRDLTGDARIALQVWQSGRVQYPLHRREAWEDAARALEGLGFAVSRAEGDVAVSVCFVPKTAVVGVNRVADSLSSWPGGEIRLAKTADQVSRAEFKLEELFKSFDLRLPARGRALDLGAAPGGWTRILAGRGFATTAVDPGDLDVRVLGLPGVVHERTTAGNYLRDARGRFDLVVNDMKMTPDRSSRLMLDALDLLKPGGRAIVTLKTGDRRVLDRIDAAFATLREGYTIEFARRLRHNRDEITVVLRTRG